MTVIVDSYTHRSGEHCASTALRNDAMSPTRMFHGRPLELDAGA